MYQSIQLTFFFNISINIFYTKILIHICLKINRRYSIKFCKNYYKEYTK